MRHSYFCSYQSVVPVPFRVLPSFPEKTDIEVTAKSSNVQTLGSLQVEVVLVESSLVNGPMSLSL